jgi:DNA-binding transcriptional LysR family regulator
MTQPAFSKQIRALEERLGIPVVERSSRSVELTAAGRALLPAASSVIESMERLRCLASEQSRRQTGHIVLGVVGGESAQPYTHAMLTELRRKHPGIRVEIRSLDFAGQFRAVASGDVDAAVLRPPVPPGLQTLHLATEPRVAALSAHDPLVANGATSVELARFRDHTFIDMPPEADREWRDYWAVHPRPDGTPVRYGPVVGDIEALMSAVGRGQGIAFLPAAVRVLYPRPGITYVDVPDLPPSTAALVWAPRNRSIPAVAALRAAARDSVEDESLGEAGAGIHSPSPGSSQNERSL